MFTQRCPYGVTRREEGFTPRARKFYSWMNERKESVKDIQQKSSFDKVAIIGDYVWFPYHHWYMGSSLSEKYRGGAFNSKNFIEKEVFTPEFFQLLVTQRPHALFGGEIKSYQKEVVPLMVVHVKEELPKFYSEWASAYPDTASKFVEISSIGRKARLDSIAINVNVRVNSGKNATFGLWDGTQIVVENYAPFFMNVDIETTELIITPKKDVVITITDDNQVTEDTIFID